ncbi:MAG TPA: phosphoenolpyruvate--protein phosphotransferase [Hyphomicrobiaceae bacterium]|nr:phosphoenolpyruvate--protein phosphotransferase [Hyphomicrobiaceae bacterium]
MQTRRGDDPRTTPPEPALRVIMRRLREIMAEPDSGQARLDKIVRQIAGLMVAEVCSIYIKRQDGSLELFATEGLNPEAVHNTRLKRGEGLVGRCAELGVPVNEPDAQNHPAFSYRPETGEEIYHSLLAVPIQRGGLLLGVLVVQNRTPRVYSEEDVEVLQATTMIIAEHLVSGAVAGIAVESDISRSLSAVIKAEPISDGIALGHIVLHEPRVVVTELLSENPDLELERLEAALDKLGQTLDEMLRHETLSKAGAHKDVLEAYRMFAADKGWMQRIRDGVKEGLTAEAAVERVHNLTRARMLRQNDPFWRERLRDLDDLSDRLLRILAGRTSAAKDAALPNDTILVARTMGPAELLDYDREKLRGLIIEDGSGQSHVAIVARALGIAAVAQAGSVIERVATGDSAIVDATSGEIHLRPSAEVVAAYSDKVRFLARRQRRYEALRERPAATKDGARIELNINAGLLADLPHLTESGADGIGLFRTELQFMISNTLPRLEQQTRIYRQVLDGAVGKRVVFRTLDIGSDKALPYLRHPSEDNPALGWRAIRIALDRPALLRMQTRALLAAAADRELSLMIPMVTAATEIASAKRLIHRELAIQRRRTQTPPSRLRIGAMIEVPSIIYELDALLPMVDFVSVGSNDLLQFLFAADRTNPRVAHRYDSLSVPALRAMKAVVDACTRYGVPVTLCGEMAGRPLEAMALIAIGFRSLSMAPASIGPVKTMILSLNAGRLQKQMAEWLTSATGSLREHLRRFAEGEGVELS